MTNECNTAAAAAPFAELPKGTFPLLVNGVPAVVGPWSIRVICNRMLRTAEEHHVQLIVQPYPAGSAHMRILWTWRAGNDQLQEVVVASVVPRPTNGTSRGSTIIHQTRHDAHRIWHSRTGKARRGLDYSLSVGHVYAPGDERGIDALWERHLTGWRSASAELVKAQQLINNARAMLEKPPT